MRFPSTLLAQIVGKKEPKDVEREIQKADLDLLDKINKISGASSILTLNQKGYTERTDDGYAMVSVTTGGTTQTVTLLPSAKAQLRSRIYSKDDSGAGELQLSCQGSDVVKYSGGSATSVYVGLVNQYVELLGVPGGYLIVGGVVQPVAEEPDTGGGWHTHIETLVNAADPTGSGDTTVTCSNLPTGTKMIAGMCDLVAATINRTLTIKDTSGNIWTTVQLQVAGSRARGWFQVALDASKQFVYAASNSDVSEVNIMMNLYWC